MKRAMNDFSGGPFGPHAPSSARAAAFEIEVETALALGRAAANTLLELSPESAELFRRHVRREVQRLKLAGPGGVDVAAMRLRTYLAE
jgi:hypothetical protein